MDNVNDFREWRAEEIAKLFLLKSKYKLMIEKYPTPLFDFFIYFKTDPSVKFAVEVKTTRNYQKGIRKQLTNIKIYKDASMITLPVLLFKIDEENEKGELDFLVLPSLKENNLLIQNEFRFEELSQDNLNIKIEIIKNWYER